MSGCQGWKGPLCARDWTPRWASTSTSYFSLSLFPPLHSNLKRVISLPLRNRALNCFLSPYTTDALWLPLWFRHGRRERNFIWRRREAFSIPSPVYFGGKCHPRVLHLIMAAVICPKHSAVCLFFFLFFLSDSFVVDPPVLVGRYRRYWSQRVQ